VTSFTQGTLENKQGSYGVYYETQFRLSNGQIIPVFYAHPKGEFNDPDPISELLEPETSIGAIYEFVIIIGVLRSITYSPVIPDGPSFDLVTTEIKSGQSVIKRNDLIRGKVLDPSWDLANLHYQAITTPRMYEQRYVLLETGIGNVVISHKALQAEEEEAGLIERVVAGGYLEWKQGRMDILAIIAKREAKPGEY
jgi:hypothetical protein